MKCVSTSGLSKEGDGDCTVLILKNADLNERDFLIHNIYKRIYWLQPFNGLTPSCTPRSMFSVFYVACRPILFACKSSCACQLTIMNENDDDDDDDDGV